MEKTIDVKGMLCDHCVKHVTDALSNLEGVAEVRVSLDDATAVVKTAESVSDAALIAAIADAGYEASVR